MFDRVSVESSCNSYPLFSFAVSAVGTRIGRRTSSRRATSDAGGAWLSEAGESGQLAEQEREKEKHESRTSSFFRHFFFLFFFFCFFRDNPLIIERCPRIPDYIFLRIEECTEDSIASRIRTPLDVEKTKEWKKKYHPTLRLLSRF